MFVNEDEDFVLGDDECYMLDGKSLREKLLDVVEQQEESIKKMMQCLFVPNHSSDRDQRYKEFSENLDLFIGSIKRLEFGLAFVRPHTEREEHVRKLQEQVDERDAVICKLARELKTIETALVEATFQAEKKLEVFQQAQENKVNSEEVIRFAHMISRNYSVAAPFTWTQGDPSRPFPTEADFAVSNLMNYRNFPGQNGPTALSMIRGGTSMDNPYQSGSTVTTPVAGQVRASPLAQFQQQQNQQWTPSPRSGIYGLQQSSPTGRGRSRGSPRILRGSSSSNNASPSLTSPVARGMTRPTLKVGRGTGGIGSLASRSSIEEPQMSSSDSSSDSDD